MTAFIGRREFITLLGGAARWRGRWQRGRSFTAGDLRRGAIGAVRTVRGA